MSEYNEYDDAMMRWWRRLGPLPTGDAAVRAASSLPLRHGRAETEGERA